MKKSTKTILGYTVIGLIITFIGIYFADFIGNVFNGMPFGDAAVLGFGMYLCMVIVVCTGIIVSRFDKEKEDKNDKDNQDKKNQDKENL